MPEPMTAPRAGLFTANDAPVPLDGVSIDAEISTFCARVVVTQRFVNREATPIEAVYVFPLDEGAAVCGFEAIVDGTLVIGEVKEREEAFRMYDEAMERGHGAFLLDEERPDVFQASVGNLPPGKDALLKITYATELPISGSAIRFSIPTTVSPRYAPAEDGIGVGRPDSETLNPPRAWRVPYGLDVSVRIAATRDITRVESPSHPVSVSTNGCHASVTLSQRDAALDRDFVLSIETAGLAVPRAWVERDAEGSEAVAVAFVPTLGDAPTPGEIVFLVDRSGSMDGTSIQEVRNALQLCLRSMIAGCAFNIIGFGSTFERLFPESRPYDERSLAEASEHVTSLRADLGGTEILPALEAALAQPRSGALARQIIALTDGQVSNTDAVLGLARKHASSARIFTFGIGAGSSQHLVNGLARAGGGKAEFIAPGERIEPKVVRQFGRLLSPALTDVRVEWGGAEVVQAPSVVPPVFSGERLLLYALLKNRAGHAPPPARLMASGPSGPMTLEVAIDTASVHTGRTVATLAARARIRELEESPEWTSARGSRQVGRKASGVRDEIIALSTKYGLISRETSYVAIERRETPVQGDVKLRRVPIALTSGWGGLEQMPYVAMPSHVKLLAPASALRPAVSRAQLGYSNISGPGDHRIEALERSVPQMSRGARSVPPPSRERAAMYALVGLQRAEGSWDLTEAFATAIGRALADLEAALDGSARHSSNARSAWATALALAWLGTNARQLEDEWRMLAAKARRWLETVPAFLPRNVAWIDEAQQFLSVSR